MKAVIKTNDRNLFYSLLQFLRSVHVTVETGDEKGIEGEMKKFDPGEYKGALNTDNKKSSVMKKLRGSGNGKLLKALLIERARDKNR